MAKRKTSKRADDTLVDIVEVKEQAQNFIEANQKYLLGALVGLIVIVGGWLVYKFFILDPRQKEAVEQVYKAQEQFERDSFKLALTDPGAGFPGFLEIMDKYSGTKAANSAAYYAGICYLHLKQYDAAIQYLKDFDADGEIFPIMKYGAMGDAYAEKGDLDKALSLYNDAVNAGDNEILTAYYLKKVGLLNEKQGKLDAAVKAYEKIKTEYPNSTEGGDIEKYIVRVTAGKG
jgi:tetratricopeptide (TPR) repeat protein